MEKFGSMVHYVINEPLREFNLRMQVSRVEVVLGLGLAWGFENGSRVE